MARSCFERSNEGEGSHSRFDSYTHTCTEQKLQNWDASTKLTKASLDVHEGIFAIALRKEVTEGSVVRQPVMRSLEENADNLAVIDSGRGEEAKVLMVTFAVTAASVAIMTVSSSEATKETNYTASSTKNTNSTTKRGEQA